MLVTQLINAKGKAVANQIIKKEDNIIIFQSYNSNIVKIDTLSRIITFGRDYKYSTTTARHRNKFLSDCLYVDIKTKDVEAMLKDGKFNDYSVNYDENL